MDVGTKNTIDLYLYFLHRVLDLFQMAEAKNRGRRHLVVARRHQAYAVGRASMMLHQRDPSWLSTLGDHVGRKYGLVACLQFKGSPTVTAAVHGGDGTQTARIANI